MFCEILGWNEEFRVRVSKEPNGGEEQERERMKKVIESGLKPFYVASKPGRTRPGPLSSHSPSFDSDPDGSGSIQRS